jgi:hypothetical protein
MKCNNIKDKERKKKQQLTPNLGGRRIYKHVTTANIKLITLKLVDEVVVATEL